MTDDYTSRRASGSQVCNRRSRQFPLAEMNDDYKHAPSTFQRKYGIDTDTFLELRRTNKLADFTKGHDTCPRLQYISKITDRAQDTASYVSAWNDSKNRYADSRGLYSGDIECVVCKAKISSDRYCKETACMASKCWKHLATEPYNVRILNASFLMGKPLFTASESGSLPQFNGVYYSPDNEIHLPALYAWDLKHHLLVMNIMNTPIIHNIRLLQKFLRLIFPTKTTGVYPFMTVLYNSNRKIFHNVSMSLIGNVNKYRTSPVAVLSAQVNKFRDLSETSKDMECQLLFYVLFQYALALDSAKSMALYGYFMDVLTDGTPAVSLARKNGTVAKYISGAAFDLNDSDKAEPFKENHFHVPILDIENFSEECNTISKRQLEAEFEAVDIDLVHPDRIPYIYKSSGGTYLDCRTKRVLANYILPSNNPDVRVAFHGSSVTVESISNYAHGTLITSRDVPDWFTMSRDQPKVILQRTYRTFYTDKKRGSVSNLIVKRLQKNAAEKANISSDSRKSDRPRFKTRTTISGHYRA